MNVSTFGIFLYFLDIPQNPEFIAANQELENEISRTYRSYNGPEFLVEISIAYPNVLTMTSNSLCEAVSNMI